VNILHKYLVPLILCVGLLFTSCKALQTMGFAAGGAAAGSLVGPGGAAAGAALGAAGSELIHAENADKDLPTASIQNYIPKSPWAEFIDSLSKLAGTLGWWYLLVFILVPIFTRRGRNWLKHLASLGDSVTKKDVGAYANRLDSLEGKISSMLKNKEDEVSKP